jgi:hypothetical protein
MVGKRKWSKEFAAAEQAGHWDKTKAAFISFFRRPTTASGSSASTCTPATCTPATASNESFDGRSPSRSLLNDGVATDEYDADEYDSDPSCDANKPREQQWVYNVTLPANVPIKCTRLRFHPPTAPAVHVLGRCRRILKGAVWLCPSGYIQAEVS